MKEAYRLHKNELTQKVRSYNQCIIVFFIYTGNIIPVYPDVLEKVQKVLQRLNKIADENGLANT